ncbi:TnsA endonuclease N-terminal domain-containing protein [Stenotrophobium rhamnosiphilum]|uniref:TnsA endonuclease N-terminal domain-containing protein n=1 Tax=Stenotrophobium rhamnosiphilum TaxID=2029166 RepID=A0A2T5MCK1_9GAMM|nr:TnsA endonuclease N-terminal domain-containing protein [Stenotrophobium rhamnosiphilum]PTU30308.1 hypothetical protein CJD38_15290 [Stenotrophobium rhamnosiphilum]
MGRGKRFTPQLFRKWKEDGRGTGTGTDYRPFHQVRRSDPASRGRSHLMGNTWSDRKSHLLSDGEKLGLIFIQQMPDLEDCLEQFPLSVESHRPFLSQFDIGVPYGFFQGTQAISESLNIRHPKVYGGGESSYWQMTTDFAVVFRDGSGKRNVLAVSVKESLPKSKRDGEKFKIEREYWKQEEHRWILFVKSDVPLAVRLNVTAISTWTSGRPWLPREALDRTQALLSNESELLIAPCLELIQKEFKVALGTAQECFWQSIWSGRIPVDLSRDLFRGAPLIRIEFSQFKAFNPIWSGVSAWPA